MAAATDYLSSYLEPLAEGLTLQQARRIVDTKPTAKLRARVEELADKANEGTLTADERAEYEYYVEVDDVIGLLKAKARQVLGDG
ncbi:MAG TPA: hypothetical protein PKC18_19165 [Lacipirellulaceae bacterium]|nr:hypothetical protein [Lacipirellulaceae bacterium]HMP07566.1 hypothetical protein [Lacipirellulaceae bacterium]